MPELELGDYTEKSDISDSLIAKSSVYNDIEYTDSIAFDQAYEGIFPTSMPLGANKLSYSAGGVSLIPYDVSASGAFAFGDGSDGNVTISANTSLTRDMFYINLIVDATFTLNPAGFRIFAQNTVLINGTIARSGNNGGNGANYPNATGGTAGAALAEGTIKGSVAGGAGGASRVGANADPGSTGNAAAQSLGSNGVAGGNGGNGGFVGGGGGTGGTATAAQISLKNNWHLFSMFDITSSGTLLKYNVSAGAGGGGGGGGAGANAGGGGGGGGSGGGMIYICAKRILIGSTGVLQVIGGNGGNGGDGGGVGNPGCGGGGGGGNGGEVIFLYNQDYINRGTITLTGGTGGAAGGGSAGGSPTAGASGTAGTLRTFRISI